jgi:ATP-dependent RNA helicase DDX49/DBP8
MIISKRRTLTTDDLLRRQEEPQKKRKLSPVVQLDEGEDSSPGEDDDFDFELALEDCVVERDSSEWERGVEESTDSEISEESSPTEAGRVGLSSESSCLLGSRVTVKPRLAHRHTLSPEAGSSKHVMFSSLGVSPLLLSALSKMAIHTPTEIQRACIPPLLAGLLFGTVVLGHR